jgi:hypothetical protein
MNISSVYTLSSILFVAALMIMESACARKSSSDNSSDSSTTSGSTNPVIEKKGGAIGKVDVDGNVVFERIDNSLEGISIEGGLRSLTPGDTITVDLEAAADGSEYQFAVAGDHPPAFDVSLSIPLSTIGSPNNEELAALKAYFIPQGSDNRIPVDDSNIRRETDHLIVTVSEWGTIIVSANNTQSATGCAYTPCGAAGNGCYDNAAAIAAGYACLVDGTQIDYQTTTAGGHIWQEHGGQGRIIHASGFYTSPSDPQHGWQQTLNPDGNGYSGTALTGSMAIQMTGSLVIQNIAGRACPSPVGAGLPAVHIDNGSGTGSTGKFAIGYCLYYDAGNYQQALNFAYSGIEFQDYLGPWDTDNIWYVGNIQICKHEGMRLPTIYETQTTTTSSSNYPTTDGTPSGFAQGNGVPSYIDYTWTASAYIAFMHVNYWLWSGSSGIGNSYDISYHVRCVLP